MYDIEKHWMRLRTACLFEFVYGTSKPQLGSLLDGATWDKSVSQQLNSTVPPPRDPLSPLKNSHSILKQEPSWYNTVSLDDRTIVNEVAKDATHINPRWCLLETMTCFRRLHVESDVFRSSSSVFLRLRVFVRTEGWLTLEGHHPDWYECSKNSDIWVILIRWLRRLVKLYKGCPTNNVRTFCMKNQIWTNVSW